MDDDGRGGRGPRAGREGFADPRISRARAPGSAGRARGAHGPHIEREMSIMHNRFFRRLAALAALALPLGAAACDGDPNEPEIAERLVLTVNSVESSLSLIPVDGG